MDIFAFRDHLIRDYASYVKSFIQIRDAKIRTTVEDSLSAGSLWPEPLLQLNPAFEAGQRIEDLVADQTLHPECQRIFQVNKDKQPTDWRIIRLHQHQSEAVRVAQTGCNYVLTTGTGSGKSLAYIVPIVNHALKQGSGKGIQAIVVYPMNALANSQDNELAKFLRDGYPEGKEPVRFARYTGQESAAQREQIKSHPPDILLTNYVMLELILTRPEDHKLVENAQGLRFLVLDELHTYRGRQGADVALLVRRVREALNSPQMQCVGTSATLAGAGNFDKQRKEVATVASTLFGAPVLPEHIIGETLRRTTPERDFNDPTVRQELAARVSDTSYKSPVKFNAFVEDPLSSWIESTFGLATEAQSGRLIRSTPRPVSGDHSAASQLKELTGQPIDRCVEAIQRGLLGGYQCEPNPVTGFSAFAFRLHQFISRGDTVYASLETEDQRYITVNGQQFVPGHREKILVPLVFCRECGQEYYSVRYGMDIEAKHHVFRPRGLSELYADEEGTSGYLYISASNPWPDNLSDIVGRLPDDWVEIVEGDVRVRDDRRKELPVTHHIAPDGLQDDAGIRVHFLAAPFRFCLNCGVAYVASQKDDFSKLASLSSEGRSTATTLLSLSAIRQLRAQTDLEVDARKLLSFTDNRQDASLQAGHFNDFIEIALLRSALYRAVAQAGPEGLTHDELALKVFAALALPPELYAAEPDAKFQRAKDRDSAFRSVLAHRLYRDLKRGWRVTSPNLEQCGLLEIQYASLDEVCAAEELWTACHPALVTASPATRRRVARTLLDFMRRELAIKVDYLDGDFQERLRQQSSQHLKDPWAIDEEEKLETASVVYPRPVRQGDYRGHSYVSGRGGFGKFIQRSKTFPEYPMDLKTDDATAIIVQLLQTLTIGGQVEPVMEGKGGDLSGYQVLASAMCWVKGDGKQAFHDPIRVPSQSAEGGRTNPFFVAFYQTAAADLHGLEAREHTAQVRYEDRQERETDFRSGKLPILYCSPTMELGVDIARLNVVNMRNVPPTPANYAQRSGRAGRSGQPALVFSYCTTGSPHDQYFFKRPERMVSGAVSPPRLDLANEDLVRAHIHAIWLSKTKLSLGRSLKELLDLNQGSGPPSLALLDNVQSDLCDPYPRAVAKVSAARMLATFQDVLTKSDWYSERWLDDSLAQIGRSFDSACDRWRGLYLSALNQQEMQNNIVKDATRSLEDKNQAKRLRGEAEEQLKLLTEVENLAQSDFYSYRYFASEGFLPGYNFPRLPLSAYIPARNKRQRDEFLSRPRFLAISEFGPRAIVYHEGSRYEINKVILPPGERNTDDDEAFSRRAKICHECGYLHPLTATAAYDKCERCESALELPLKQLFRLQNVSTRRRERISCDEEERVRMGYDLLTGVRFADHGSGPSYRTAIVKQGDTILARMAYGGAATLWRINKGWRRRKNKNLLGFVLDIERGYWDKNEAETQPGKEDPMSPRAARVIPYVEDRRNCLLFTSEEKLEPPIMASLQAALKTAIQVVFQLEDNEIAAEPLPSNNNRKHLLFYEASEGGAGVLRRLLDEPEALARVCEEALQLCHFDPQTGADEGRASGAREDCEAACYDCLLSYSNQRDHELLDRKAIRDLLMRYRDADVVSSPAEVARGTYLDNLLALTDSELERNWLRHLDSRGHRLPTSAQKPIAEGRTKPDFLYEGESGMAAIYIDGPPHDFPSRQQRDAQLTEMLENKDWLVIRFHHQDDWNAILARFPSLFGRPK